MQQIVGVRFKIGTKIYNFSSETSLKKGDFVIVETSLGQGFGVVEKIEDFKEGMELKPVIRKATKDDVKQNEDNLEKERVAIQTTKQLVEEMNLDMNVVNAEYSFDGSKVVLDFISDNRVDFRDLVKELATKLKTRIELRQIGIRDQAKMVGGIGICGRVCCCASHLKDFEKVSIKMAKVQGLALNPTKISGSCGRLMCCLEYENDYYSEVYPKTPKINGEVKTPDGIGTVLYTNALKQIASVKIVAKDDSITIKDYSFDDLSKSSSNKESNEKEENKIKAKETIKLNLKESEDKNTSKKEVSLEKDDQKDSSKNKNSKKKKKHFDKKQLAKNKI